MTFRRINPDEVLARGDHWITVTKGVVAWFGVEMWMNEIDIPGTVFPEPYDKAGLYRHDKLDAAREAYSEARRRDLPYYLPDFTDGELAAAPTADGAEG